MDKPVVCEGKRVRRRSVVEYDTCLNIRVSSDFYERLCRAVDLEGKTITGYVRDNLELCIRSTFERHNV